MPQRRNLALAILGLALLAACAAPSEEQAPSPPPKMSDAEEAYITRVNQTYAKSDPAFQARIEQEIQAGKMSVPKDGAAGLTRQVRLLSAPKPDRPRFPGTEAGIYTVRVEFVVTSEGTPERLGVVGSTDHRFDSSALSAVAKWRFAPALVYGKPVTSTVVVPVAFAALDDFTRPLRFYR